MNYEIRFANKGDTSAIMRFIDEYWKQGHILSRNKVLFDWQYGRNDDRLNIVIGLDKNGSIQGMLGFIPYNETDDKDISLALWKANPSAGFLGVRLIRFLEDHEPHRAMVCPGINLGTTKKIYEHIGMSVGTMTQWYRLARRDEYKVAKVVDAAIPTPYFDNNFNGVFVKINSAERLYEVFNTECEAYNNGIPYKSLPYIIKRYFKHPIYHYLVYAYLKSGVKSDILFIFRIQDCNGSHVLRLIDCIGQQEMIREVTEEIDKMLQETDCEYIDFYESGLDSSILKLNGWRKVEEDGNVIPDYFAPFEQKKVDIHYSSSIECAVLFKGDGDQDRPN